MSNKPKERKSQRDIFIEATQELSRYNRPVTSILIRDMFTAITRSMMVLDGLLIRIVLLPSLILLGQFENGSSVAVIRSRIHSEYCQKDYYIPVSILYPISGRDQDRIKFFLLVNNSVFFQFIFIVDTTVNKQCYYVDQNNEIHMSGIDLWKWVFCFLSPKT